MEADRILQGTTCAGGGANKPALKRLRLIGHGAWHCSLASVGRTVDLDVTSPPKQTLTTNKSSSCRDLMDDHDKPRPFQDACVVTPLHQEEFTKSASSSHRALVNGQEKSRPVKASQIEKLQHDDQLRPSMSSHRGLVDCHEKARPLDVTRAENPRYQEQISRSASPSRVGQTRRLRILCSSEETEDVCAPVMLEELGAGGVLQSQECASISHPSLVSHAAFFLQPSQPNLAKAASVIDVVDEDINDRGRSNGVSPVPMDISDSDDEPLSLKFPGPRLEDVVPKRSKSFASRLRPCGRVPKARSDSEENRPLALDATRCGRQPRKSRRLVVFRLGPTPVKQVDSVLDQRLIDAGGEPLHLRGINIQRPWARLILNGSKTIEARKYHLTGYMNEDLWVIETAGMPGTHRVALEARIDQIRGKADVAVEVHRRSSAQRRRRRIGCAEKFEARIIGVIRFGSSFKYESLEQWRADVDKHCIPEGSKFDWKGPNPDDGTAPYAMHGWRIDKATLLAEPQPGPRSKGMIGASAVWRVALYNPVSLRSICEAGMLETAAVGSDCTPPFAVSMAALAPDHKVIDVTSEN